MQCRGLTKAGNQHHGKEGVVLDADHHLGDGVVKHHGGLVEGGAKILEELVGQRKEGQMLQHRHSHMSMHGFTCTDAMQDCHRGGTLVLSTKHYSESDNCNRGSYLNRPPRNRKHSSPGYQDHVHSSLE